MMERVNTVIPLITGCAGFLLAILYLDLVFDVQVFSHRRAGDLPESVLASIAAYYRRATTTSRPMSRLIVVVMLVLSASLIVRACRGRDPIWVIGLSAALAGVPMLLAALRTVPNAKRLGRRTDTVAEQSSLARSICRQHLVEACCMTGVLALWVAHGA